MSADQEPKQNGQNGKAAVSCVNMESVHRIAQLPVVESTIQTATNIYGKVKVICDSSFLICKPLILCREYGVLELQEREAFLIFLVLLFYVNSLK